MNNLQISQPVVEEHTLAFSDPTTCAQWTKTLPFSSISQVCESLLTQLQRFARAEFNPRERATIAEVLREPVLFAHTELARRYAGKPQPAAEREANAATLALALWQALWEQYSLCLKPLLDGDEELQGVKAKLVQRGLYVGKQQILVHGLARRAPPASLWQELHAYYRLAEILDCTATAVSDELQPQAIGVSCYSTYSHALLLSLADPCAMSVRQIELTDRWLHLWARKVFPYVKARRDEAPIIVIDTKDAHPGQLALAPPREASEATRFGYPGKLALSVRGRLKRLSGGANPAELQLGSDASAEACVNLLAYLDQHWYGSSSAPAKAGGRVVELCGGGIPAAHFRVGGRTFDIVTDPRGRTSYTGTQHLSTLAALTDYDTGRETAERTWPWEKWQGSYEWHEAVLTRADNALHRWYLEQLVTLKNDDHARCGWVARVELSVEGGMAITIKLWPGTPQALTLRSITTLLYEDPPVPALQLSETPQEDACLIVPPRTFSVGRQIRTVEGGGERRYKLTRLIQRGADFERVAFSIEK